MRLRLVLEPCLCSRWALFRLELDDCRVWRKDFFSDKLELLFMTSDTRPTDCSWCEEGRCEGLDFFGRCSGEIFVLGVFIRLLLLSVRRGVP